MSQIFFLILNVFAGRPFHEYSFCTKLNTRNIARIQLYVFLLESRKLRERKNSVLKMRNVAWQKCE
jgi:hypothetical protein